MEKDSLEQLIQQMQDSNITTQENAIQQIVDVQGDAAVDALNAVILNADAASNARTLAARTLGRIGTPNAIRKLLSLLEQDVPKGVYYVSEAMDKVTNPTSIDVLLGALNSADETTRQLAAGALGRMGSQQAIHALVERLTDDDALVRCNAVWALGKIGNEAAVPALIRALDDDNQQVRILAIIALGKLQVDSDEIANSLAKMLADVNIEVRREASGALVQFGSGACEAVIPQLQNTDVAVRELAALVMRWISDNRAVTALTQALNDASPYVRHQAARTLGRLRDQKAIAPLKTLLQDPDTRIRQTAEMSLKKLGVDVAE